MLGGGPVTRNVDRRDPRRIADVALAAAVRAHADAVYVEPAPGDPDHYVMTIERGPSAIASVKLDAQLGAAVVARLAYIADLDLAAPHASSARVPVRSGARDAEVVVTVRPGNELRADLMVTRARGKLAPAVGPTAGDTIGNYRVLQFLGEGGMGTVFSVEHTALERRYALKVLRTRVVERDPTAAQQFLREARTAARVRHPNIVDVFDFGHLPDGRPYFVMELLEGESLGDRLERVGPLQPGEVVAIARQLAEALAAAHDRGVIHADVTPSNALVVDSNPATSTAPATIHVKLVDFGLAMLAGEGLRDDNPEFVLGTPAYISPEQLRGLAATDRSDQYGLGAVLFELLTGHPPYEHEDLRKLCLMHIQAPIPAVTSPHGPLPPKLADIITTCLQKTPQARFPGIRAMLAAIDEIERVTDRRGWRRWLSS